MVVDSVVWCCFLQVMNSVIDQLLAVFKFLLTTSSRQLYNDISHYNFPSLIKITIRDSNNRIGRRIECESCRSLLTSEHSLVSLLQIVVLLVSVHFHGICGSSGIGAQKPVC